MRKHLKLVFDPIVEKGEEPVRPGKHHWSTQRWFEEASHFLSEDLVIGSSDRDVWALVLLLYPAFGPSHNFQADDSIMTNLGQEGIMIYKEVFDKNRAYSRYMFLSNQFIKKLWPTLR